MTIRSLPLFAVPTLLALGSCQSAETLAATDSRLASMEAGQNGLRAELRELRELLTLTLTQQPAATFAAPDPGATDLAHALEAFAARLDRARSPAPAPSSTVEAAHEGAGRAAGEHDAIQVLTEGLATLEQQRALHAENLANLHVPGYKRRDLQVRSVLCEEIGVRLPDPAVVRTWMLQGALEMTGNPLDFSVEGEGFFEIQLPDGRLHYTRDGRFRQDLKGRLVTAEGFLLSDRVAIPPDSQGVAVSEDGQVFSLGDENGLDAIGTIRLHRFASPEALRLTMGGRFAPTVSSGPAQARQPGTDGAGHIRQGCIERSNVSLRDEVVKVQLVDRHATAIRRLLAGYGILTR